MGCVLGNNSYVGQGCTLEKTLVLGNDYYTNDKTRAASLEKGESALGIGELIPVIAAPSLMLAVGHNRSEHGVSDGFRTRELAMLMSPE